MTSQTAPGTTYTYMMSDTYCRNWTAPMAIREIIANALDASPPDDIILEWDMGMGYVENKGVLLQKEHLLLGESQKSTDQIGQFGEGLKLAALALCRDHRTVWVASGEHQYIFSIQHNTDFERNLLLVTISNNQQLTHYFSLMATPKTRKPRKENQS